jgi:hypothetical protein
VSRLELDAESIRTLENAQLRDVAGGSDGSSQRTICFCAGSKRTICEM